MIGEIGVCVSGALIAGIVVCGAGRHVEEKKLCPGFRVARLPLSVVLRLPHRMVCWLRRVPETNLPPCPRPRQRTPIRTSSASLAQSIPPFRADSCIEQARQSFRYFAALRRSRYSSIREQSVSRISIPMRTRSVTAPPVARASACLGREASGTCLNWLRARSLTNPSAGYTGWRTSGVSHSSRYLCTRMSSRKRLMCPTFSRRYHRKARIRRYHGIARSERSRYANPRRTAAIF